MELEQFVELCESVGMRDLATVTADIDMGTDDGHVHGPNVRRVRGERVRSKVGAGEKEDAAKRRAGLAAWRETLALSAMQTTG